MLQQMQDNAPVHIFGKKAVVAKHNTSMLTLMVDMVKFVHGVEVKQTPARFECDVADVVEIPAEQENMMKAKEMKALGSLTKPEKRFMMKTAWNNSAGYALNGLPGKMLDDGDLWVIFEYLQWQYQQPVVGMVKANIVKLALVFGDSPDGEMAIMQIKDAMRQCEVLLLPVHCDAPLHWTALELHMKPDSDEIIGVKYGDWLGGLEQSANLAQLLLNLISMKTEQVEGQFGLMELPRPFNHYVQRSWSNDCGFVVWQMLENAMKRLRLEPDVGVYPDPNRWRKTLKTLLEAMVKE